jgi:hypothetical protein
LAYLGNPLSTMDFPVDYFTGDGTSTTFQLSRIPASATSILVHIGGVKQVASTTDPAYYLDGSKLVFVSPPGAYSPIEVNYLGIAGQVNIPGVQSVTQDMLSLQLANTFVYQTTANGATASFTLNAPPVSANSLVVSANGVVQYDYSVNGTNLTFGFTPPVGTFIRITSLALAQAGVPSDGSVTTVKLGSNLTLTGNTTINGNLGISNTSPTWPLTISSSTTLSAGNPALVIQGQSNTERLIIRSVGNTGAGTPVIGVFGGRGTIAAPTASQSGDPIAYYQMGGHDGTNYQRGAWILGYAGENWSATNRGTYMVFSTTPNASTTIAERMRIDDAGNVGIATSSPSTFGKFAVQGASSNRVFYADALAQPVARYDDNSFVSNGLTIRNTGITGSNQGIGLLFQLGASGTAVNSGSIEMRSEADYSTSANQDAAMTFATVLNGTNTERMRIDSSGNVGIGTASPLGKIDASWGGRTASQIPAILVGANSDSTTRSNDTQKMGVIGAAHYTNAQSPVGLISSNSYASNNDVYLGGGFASVNAATTLSFWTAANSTTTQGTERMRIDSSGNVAIGRTSSISYKLDVDAGAGSAARLLSNNAQVLVGFNSTSFNYYDADTQIFRNNAGTERMRITSDGNLLVGATSAVSSSKFLVAGVSSSTSPAIQAASSAGGYLYFYNNAQTSSSFQIGQGWASGTDNVGVLLNNANAAMILGTNGTERMRITSGGDFLFGQSTYTNPPTTGADLLAGGLVINPTRRTTGSSANCNWDASTGNFARSTSSLRYKTDVQNATYGLSDVLKLRPVTYKGKSEADGDKVFGGFIAEEIDELGLKEFVEYDSENQPDSLAYGNMVSLLTKAIQEQQAMIEELKAEIQLLKVK